MVSGLILTGGRGRRVGGSDKGLLPFENKPLIEHQIDWLSTQVDKILISANRNISTYSQYGVVVIQDKSSEFAGPLYGVLAALEVCPTDWLFVLPVDMPNLPNGLVRRFDAFLSNSSPIRYLVSVERAHYLSMLIHRDQLEHLREYLGARNPQNHGRVKDFLKAVEAEPLDLGLNESCFQNMNSLSDFGTG